MGVPHDPPGAAVWPCVHAGLRSSSLRPAKASRTMPVVHCKKVAVLGAAGGIGQPLSLLLKMNKCVTELALFDVAPVVKGVAVDISHCNTPVQVGSGCKFAVGGVAQQGAEPGQGRRGHATT